MTGSANKQVNVHPVKTGMPTRKHPNNEISFIIVKIVEAGNLCCRWLAVFCRSIAFWEAGIYTNFTWICFAFEPYANIVAGQ
jgi:hypothetical protein